MIKPDSYYILDAVVATMNGYPDIELIEVQGHGETSRSTGATPRRHGRSIVV